MVIRKASVSAMDNNCYLLTCRATGAQLLIDAADDATRLLGLVHEGSPTAGSTWWSPRTSTGTTTGRCATCSPRPAPTRRPAPRTPVSCR